MQPGGMVVRGDLASNGAFGTPHRPQDFLAGAGGRIDIHPATRVSVILLLHVQPVPGPVEPKEIAFPVVGLAAPDVRAAVRLFNAGYLSPRGHLDRSEFTVPLCRSHHRDNHSFGDEVAWWERRAIDPVATSRMLWVSTRRIE
jgi:hypothetical protein